LKCEPHDAGELAVNQPTGQIIDSNWAKVSIAEGEAGNGGKETGKGTIDDPFTAQLMTDALLGAERLKLPLQSQVHLGLSHVPTGNKTPGLHEGKGERDGNGGGGRENTHRRFED